MLKHKSPFPLTNARMIDVFEQEREERRRKSEIVRVPNLKQKKEEQQLIKSLLQLLETETVSFLNSHVAFVEETRQFLKTQHLRVGQIQQKDVASRQMTCLGTQPKALQKSIIRRTVKQQVASGS